MEHMQKLTLTRATEEDCRFLYDLRNDEDVRKNSFQTETFSYESHVAWYKEKLGDKQTQIYVLKLDGENIGQARVDLHGVDGEISYALCQKARGYGYAKWMLRCMEDRLREQAFCRKMTAEVKRENIASQKIFEGLSYSSVSTDYGYIYEKEIPLFTIIMCTYNSAQTVDAAISSVKNQKFDGWEMLILDNGSSDATVEKLKQYERLDERIKCIYRKDNIGWCKGISECLKMSVGSYMMFLGADDFMTTEQTLSEVAGEVVKHHPQVIFTGSYYAKYEQGRFRIVNQTLPEYRVFKENRDKLTCMAELMKNVYYNSVMHYVKIDFLKENGIDFYYPFYGDCQGMTEAIVRAEKIVVMSQPEYVLTLNTSQSSKRCGYNHDEKRQWDSIKAIIPDKFDAKDIRIQYIARRVLDNLTEMYQNIALGEPLCDSYMNAIEKSLPERFARVEEMISTQEMGEMINYAGREEYAECLIGAAGVNYWICKKNKMLLDEICRNSKWLAEFVEAAMEMDETAGMVIWKKRFDRDAGERLLQICQNPWNRFKTGVELLLKDDVWYEDTRIREKLCEVKESGVIYAMHSFT
jgi:RimJ/RimL family protein N-acetyltransferase